MKNWYLLSLASLTLLAGCAELLPPSSVGAGAVTQAKVHGDDRLGPFNAPLKISGVPNNPECISIDELGRVTFTDCEFSATMTGRLVSHSYTSMANGTIGGQILALHTIEGCLRNVGCGTLQGLVGEQSPERGVFSWDMRGIDGDLEGVRINGFMHEIFNNTPDFDFIVKATLDLEFDDDDDDDD